jgi:hypothetical protein
MSQPVTADPTDDDSTQVSPPLQGKQPDREPPVQPNPYMGGGEPPA